MTRYRLSSSFLSILLAILAARPALAQDPDERARLLKEAKTARDAGEHSTALDRARRAYAMKASSSLLRFMAEEHVDLGQHPEAYELAERCVDEAQREPPSPNNDAVLTGCRWLLHEERPRVAVVRMVVASPPPPGLTLSVAGGPEEPERRAWVVAPGLVRVAARAPGRQPFFHELSVEGGSETTLTVELEPEIEQARPAEAPPPAAAPAVARRAPTDRPRAPAEPLAGSSSRASFPYAPVFLIGSGVAAGLAGGGVWLAANGEYDALRERCAATGCPDLADERAAIERLDAIALTSALLGAGLAAAGIVVAIVSATGDAPPRRARVELRVGPGIVGLGGAL